MQKFLFAALFLLSLPLALRCQTYATSPFYQLGGSPGTIHLWNSQANGVRLDITATETINSRGRGWSESMYIDGSKQQQVVHRYVQFDNLHVVFGYDLLLEPIDGTTKVRCSFSTLTDPTNGAFKMRDHTFVMTPLSSDLSSIIVESASYISIAMLPGPPKEGLYIETLRIDLPKETNISSSKTGMPK